jgi:exoribonuclease R
MAEFLENQNSPALERIVKKPERWLRIVELARTFDDTLPPEPDSRALSDFLERRRTADPAHFPDLSLSVVKLIGAGDYAVAIPGIENEGHFGLAVNDYAHSTAPNRRYADLIAQRLVKTAIKNAPAPYSIAELEQIAARCNDRQSAARKVERKMRKIVAAQVLSRSIGKVFAGIVTGASRKGVFVRLLNPPAEGKIVVNENGVDVGDHVQVRLIKTEAELGFVDFERI